MEADLGVAAGVSDRGRRRRNEDSMAFASLDLAGAPQSIVAVVCDGVATTADADQASQIVSDTATDVLISGLRDGDPPDFATRAAVAGGFNSVIQLAAGTTESPSCTYVSAVVTQGTITIGWLGDSRAYWLSRARRGPRSGRLTIDDSVAGHRNAISRWIGADIDETEPHLIALRPAAAGLLLLCSDGLWNYFPEAASMIATLNETPNAWDNPFTAADSLTEVALARGGHDNITAVVIPVG
jgi:serine/threonine protein phosphatase PrpC